MSDITTGSRCWWSGKRRVWHLRCCSRRPPASRNLYPDIWLQVRLHLDLLHTPPPSPTPPYLVIIAQISSDYHLYLLRVLSFIHAFG